MINPVVAGIGAGNAYPKSWPAVAGIINFDGRSLKEQKLRKK
jgi:hypothetical protein